MPDENASEVVGEIRRIPRDSIRPMPNQPREYFDPVALKELADSIQEIGQAVAIIVRPVMPPEGKIRFELIEGQRRWHACEMISEHFMRAEIRFPKDADEQFIMSVIANFAREPNNCIETAKSVNRIKGMGKTNAQISKIFGKSETWVSQHLKLLKLDPAVLKLLSPEMPDEKRISFNTALLLTDLPISHQLTLGRAISELGLSMAGARHLIKKTVYTEKIRVPRRRPGDDYRSFSGFFDRAFDQFEIFLDMPVGQLDEMLKGGKTFQRSRLVEKLDELVVQLTQIKESVLGFEKRRK